MKDASAERPSSSASMARSSCRISDVPTGITGAAAALAEAPITGGDVESWAPTVKSSDWMARSCVAMAEGAAPSTSCTALESKPKCALSSSTVP